jgi:hypothetical protein
MYAWKSSFQLQASGIDTSIDNVNVIFLIKTVRNLIRIPQSIPIQIKYHLINFLHKIVKPPRLKGTAQRGSHI